MKDSGIEWIGEIPANWNVDKIKFHLRRNEPKNPGNTIVLSLYREFGVIPKDSRDDNHNVTSEDTSKYKYVQKGDFVVNKMKAWQGSVAVSEYEGIVSPAYYVYHFTDNIFNKRYFHYLLRGCYKDEFMRLSAGIRVGQWDLSSENLDNTLVIIPSFYEQEKICDFLDTKCKEIDALTVDIQTQIDILDQYKKSVITEAVTKGLNKDAELKDSCIFYMAPYNSKWRLSKIGYECTKLWRSFDFEDTALLCTNKGKVAIRPEEMSGKMVSEDNAMQGIRKGDIAIHGMDTWHGAIALSEYNGKITRVVHVCDSCQDKRFIVYYLQQLAFNGVYKLISNGVRENTSDFRSWEKVKNIYIALPDIEEQNNIASYLDILCSKIDQIIKLKKEQLLILSDYKKSIIYEYVTGKKEIPNG
ncbi:MAG: restriction endonuclease subunit S [Eubacterium sp.]|nr:restriction endonuclease subunit S [Eubacterium sp.]